MSVPGLSTQEVITNTIRTFYDAIATHRDPYETTHGGEVARIAVQMAEILQLPAQEITLLKVAAHLHDVGKVGLPEHILNKPGRFTLPERLMVQQHTVIGMELLRPFQLGPIIYDVVLHHHERHDGNGYPHKLRGDSLSVHASIVHIADVYDALTHERPYRLPLSSAEALHMIKSDAGAWSPKVLAAFMAAYKQVQYG